MATVDKHSTHGVAHSFASRLARGPSNYGEVIGIAGPLVLSTASMSIMHFVDRMFLSRYSMDAFAAALPAGLLAFTIISLFLGTAGYANTFVAQYLGAGRRERIGPAIWQGVWFALGTGVLVAVVAPGLAEPLFRWVGHAPEVQRIEIVYFRIFCLGSLFTTLSGALSSFFSGRGKTWPIVWVHASTMVLNIVLDYAWIFGHWGFPAWGAAGAAWATVLSTAAGALGFALLFLAKQYRQEFATLSGWRFDPELFGRLFRFGLPNGIQFMLDMLAFSLFVALVGRIGPLELTASNLSFQINHLFFMPMLGFGQATATLVGRRLGEDRPHLAARVTWSAFHLTFGYMCLCAFFYILTPMWFITPFLGTVEKGQYEAVCEISVVLLRFVAFYSVFDCAAVIFSSALKGAGDTRFPMYFSVIASWTLMTLPAWIICRPGGSLYLAWSFISFFVIVLAAVFLWRFIEGKWRDMRVIEPEAIRAPGVDNQPVPGAPPEPWAE